MLHVWFMPVMMSYLIYMGEQMTSRVDLLLEGIIDRASMELEVVFFSFFSGV